MKASIKDYDLKKKTIIIRSDLNVPIKEGKILDDTRIKESIKTIKYAIDKKAKVIILSHLGKVKTEEDKKDNSLKIVGERLNQLLDNKLTFIPKTRGIEVENAIKDMSYGSAILLENTRYEDLNGEKESKNDPELGKYWSSLCDLFINDAFGTLHRSHASNVGISMNKESAIGFLVEKELNELDKLDSPDKEFTIIMGGAKVSDKIGVINTLIKKVDKIIIGGGMAFTFLKASNINVGKSLVEDKKIAFCQGILKNYKNKIILPIDFKVVNEYKDISPMIVEDIKDYQMGLDIGPKTVNLFKENLKKTKTCFWNGPLGVYEFLNFQEGTKEILKYLANSDIYSILGGGDIVAAANNFNYQDKINFLSTGGGASLSYLENKDLPGLKYIKEK